MQSIVLIGGYGDGLVAAQIIADMRSAGCSVSLLGFLNDALKVGDTINCWPVLGKIKDWEGLSEDIQFHICLHKVGMMDARIKLIESLCIPESRLISLVHPTACIADDVIVGKGSMICQHVTCQPGSVIGNITTIRAGANVGHDAKLGNYCYLGPNASLCGRSEVKTGAHVGPNAVVVDAVVLEQFSIAGAGAVIFKSTPKYSTWIGNPARRAK